MIRVLATLAALTPPRALVGLGGVLLGIFSLGWAAGALVAGGPPPAPRLPAPQVAVVTLTICTPTFCRAVEAAAGDVEISEGETLTNIAARCEAIR